MSKGSPSDRLPYPVEGDPGVVFEAATEKALVLAEELAEVHASPLRRLTDLEVNHYGGQESEGATYRQLRFIAHWVGMDQEQRSEWYRIALEIPLSARHASHITGRLINDQLKETRELGEMWGRDA